MKAGLYEQPDGTILEVSIDQDSEEYKKRQRDNFARLEEVLNKPTEGGTPVKQWAEIAMKSTKEGNE